ncbi:MAG: CdaR family protein [Bacilli bacterium]
MKKISSSIFSFLKRILLFFDKWLITPITKGILKISEAIQGNSKGLERFINNKQTLIVLSLVFAFIVFFVVDANSNTIINQSAEILYNQPVKAEYNEEAYVVEGLPKSVDITLIGRRADIYLAKQHPSYEVSVDLREMKPGSHKVTLKYKQALDSIDYKLDPSTATIVVYEKVSETRELNYDVLHKDQLNSKLVISNIELGRNDVIIKGAEYKLKQVATVKALVDINNISNPKVGVITLKDVPLIAYDSDGKQVDVEIVPKTIEAKITITAPSKEIPIKIVPIGELAFGKAISSLTSSVANIVIYGDQAIIDTIDSFPVEIDIDKLDKDKSFNINLKKPNGIRDMSVRTIEIKLTLDEVITKEFNDISISPINLASGYKVQAMSEADSKVTIIVKGTKAALEALNQATIKATINLSNLTTGEHEVEVVVVGNDLKLIYESKLKKVKIRIEPDKK